MVIEAACFAARFGAARFVLRCTLAGGFVCASMVSEHVHAANHSRGYAVSSLNLPINNTQASAYAIDLNGDGHVDNAFGGVLSALGSTGLDISGATASATTAGQSVHLVEIRSSDEAFANDTGAEAIWYLGEATPSPPLFDGTDTFEYDGAYAPGAFLAPLSGGGFVSANPATTTTPVDIEVDIQIGNYVVALPLQGARLKFTAVGVGLAQGQINGSIRDTDVYVKIFPTLAADFNDIIQADAQSTTAQTLLSLFDKNPTDGFISVDEVATSPFMSTMFAPDVQIRDQDGNYAPNPANTNPDALSFGFGFSAVESNVVLPPIFADGFDK